MKVGRWLDSEQKQQIVEVIKLFTKLGVPLFGGFDIFGKGAEMKITLDLKPHY